MASRVTGCQGLYVPGKDLWARHSPQTAGPVAVCAGGRTTAHGGSEENHREAAVERYFLTVFLSLSCFGFLTSFFRVLFPLPMVRPPCLLVGGGYARKGEAVGRSLL